jgi:1,6-anhydro-N-acetylmuramate kinase
VELATAIEKMNVGERQLSVGLISGTSMDGIDACVLEITEELNKSATASHQQLK